MYKNISVKDIYKSSEEMKQREFLNKILLLIRKELYSDKATGRWPMI